MTTCNNCGAPTHHGYYSPPDCEDCDRHEKAITSLRAALAEATRERDYLRRWRAWKAEHALHQRCLPSAPGVSGCPWVDNNPEPQP